MGTASEGSEGGGIVGDCGVGTIVWVRRRNGSWWPGRVLGADELADSHLMSLRSGTPVKLLGREDASVDWYNLEKSRRVKPFRCGEFDACIEKAEASYSTPIKRREKYARREDAILHALELEKQQREIKQESTTACNILSICERDSNHYTSETHVQSKLSNQKSHNSSRKVTPLLDEYYLDHPLLLHRNRQVKPENDKHEITTHMRIEDVGAEIFESKGKLIHSVSGANSYITDESQPDLLPQSGHNSVFITQAASCKNFSIAKRKTLLTGAINYTIPKRKSLLTGAINDTPTKRRDRRRPLVKVLQSSIKLPVSYSLQPHHDSSINIIPGEENHADITHGAQKDITVYSSHDAEDPLYYSRNLLKHLPDDAGNAYHLQDSGCMSNESTPSGWTEGNEFDSSATDSELEIVEEKLRSGITQPFELTAQSPIESGMSQWHLKGKRKNRTITKSLHESVEEKKLGGTDRSDVQLKEASPDKFESAMINDSLGHKISSEKESDYDTEDDELFGGDENKRDDLLSQSSDYIDSDDDPRLISQTVWGSIRPFSTWRAYWDGPENGHERFYGSPFTRRMMPMLVDVDLKVQARYQGKHVPLVSVVSKLNGKAIIGHGVRIEVLEDGSTDLFLLPSNESEEDTTPLQIWRTAKRTAPRVPRPNSNPLKSSYLENSAPRLKKKSIYHSHRSASGRFQRRPLKAASLSSSQKTRALSSFVSEKQLGGGGVFFSSGLIKPDGSMPPTTCIPTKVVFSRIIESLGRPTGPTRL